VDEMTGPGEIQSRDIKNERRKKRGGGGDLRKDRRNYRIKSGS